ncbi:flagellar hook-associated protein 3 FlgL [Brevundimonas alba]|uniref:Flagellar hook-associated protein 3 FlgL n=1 Tax=Brevundimonas alba TaxID=74314 RepID=A0A7X5YKK5_9CAUL|nr:flagellin [Brevundimonas alba]NJC41622.1 flagellar hook-associated protein 3 FlgL [Brevundimonas alba]
MTRVATFGNYQSALLDLMKAQTRAADAQERVSTQKNATDLTGFGRQSETLTALKGAQSRIQGFIDTSKAVSARLTTQDLAMNQIGDGIAGLRQAVGSALSTDSAGSLMLELEGHFQEIRGGLTMRHQGGYLFAGASTTTSPMTVASLGELAAAPDVPSVFQNDTLKTASRVAEGTTLETGFLADELGGEVLEILRDIQTFHAGANGPLTGKMTEAQKTFLTTQLGRLEQAATAVIDKIAKTGSMANQVESITKSHEAQLGSLDELVSDRTDADMAVAITDLQLSQVAIQASAQVISQLRQVSLLNYLT